MASNPKPHATGKTKPGDVSERVGVVELQKRGVNVEQLLEKLGARGTQLKWPNDLLLNGRKLGGILIEVQGDSLGPSTAIIGACPVRIPTSPS